MIISFRGVYMEKIIGTFVRIYVKENQRCEAFGKKPLNKVIAEMALKMDITDFVEYKVLRDIYSTKNYTHWLEKLSTMNFR